jgi:flagellar biosynthesis/type III secretory pathway protein FliH
MVGKILKKDEMAKKEGPLAEQRSAARRAAELMPDAGGIVHKKVLNANDEADRILLKAEAEAERIKAEAKQVLLDAEMKREAGIKKGYADGESKGLAQLTEKLLAFGQLKERFYADAEPDVIKLVMTIAEKVIGRVVLEHQDMIRSVVHQALEKAIGDRIVVKLNPEDYRKLMEGDHEFREVIDRTRRLIFREDDAIVSGGCIVETEVGTIDAQIDTQLKAIRKALGI